MRRHSLVVMRAPPPHPRVPWTIDDSTALVSLDIFDTVLLRRVETPAKVFDEVGRRARLAGLIDAGLTPPLFRMVRQDAECRARQEARQDRGTDEVGVADIYRQIAVGDPAALMALEIAVEAEVLFANPFLLKGLQDLAVQGRPVVLLSDMYLPPGVIRRLLSNAGIGEALYRDLYVSCAHGCSKRDGGLFRLLLNDHPDLSAASILHVGDDPVGDVAMARAAGLCAVHYTPSSGLARMRERERAAMGVAGLDPPFTRRLAALATWDDAADDAFWLEFGALVLGPAVAEYCRWVVEDCQTRGIRLIAPLMREADLFAPLMREWIDHRGYAIRVEPLFTSRQALAQLELAGLDGASARSLLTARPHLQWDALLHQAGGKVPPALAELAGLTLERLAGRSLLDGGAALDAVLALFDAPDLRDSAAKRAAETQALAQAYLAERLGAEDQLALMDLGARGRTPAAIIDLLDDGRRRAHVYLCYGVPDLAGPLGSGIRASVFCGETDLAMTLGRILYRSPQILERALTGLCGTTRGYRWDEADRAIPEIEEAPAHGEEAQALALLQAGIRRYADMLRAGCPRQGDAHLPTGEKALFPLACALLMPTDEEARRLGALRYDYNDGTGLERGICDAEALAAVAGLGEAVAAPLMSMALGLRPLTVPWPQGALTLQKPGIFRRPAEALALEVGHGAVCRALVAEIQNQGMMRVSLAAVGGDGGMGPEFIHIAREAGLDLVAYADLMPHLVPQTLYHGVPVLPFERLPDCGAVPVALVTLGYADRLASLLHDHFDAAGQSVRMIALGRPDLQWTTATDGPARCGRVRPPC